MGGKSSKDIQTDVLKEMGAGRMSHQDGWSIINQIKEKDTKSANDPKYKKEASQAQEYIKASVPMSAKGYMGLRTHGQTEKQMIVEINREAMKYEENGSSPYEAAQLATSKVIGLQSLNNARDRDIQAINNDPEKLEAYVKILEKRYHEAENMTPELETKMKNQMKEAKLRIMYLQQKQKYNDLVNIVKPKEPTK
jgi:hypothetical protein